MAFGRPNRYRITDDPRIRANALTLNEQLRNETIAYAHQVELYKRSSAVKVRRMIERTILPDMLEEVSSLDGATSFQSERVRQSLLAMRSIASRLRDVRDTMAHDMADFAVSEAEWQANTIQRLMPIDYTMKLPPVPTLEALARNSPINGRLYQDWWESIEQNTRKGVEQQLRIGLSSGETTDDIARRVSSVTRQTVRQSQSLVRTTATHVSAMAREATFQRNADIISGVQWLATLDTRTTPICASRDGEVYAVNYGPRPPAHFQCRSTVVPVVKDAEDILGDDADELPPETRASMDGQVPSRVTYSDWLRSQPVSVQNQALGPQRAELFRSGKVEIGGFGDKTGRMYSLHTLRRRAGLDRGDQTSTFFRSREIRRAFQENGSLRRRAHMAWREFRESRAYASGLRRMATFEKWAAVKAEQLRDKTGWDKMSPITRNIVSWAASKKGNVTFVMSDIARGLMRAGGMKRGAIGGMMTAASIVDEITNFAGIATLNPVLHAVKPGTLAAIAFGGVAVTARGARAGVSGVASVIRVLSGRQQIGGPTRLLPEWPRGAGTPRQRRMARVARERARQRAEAEARLPNVPRSEAVLPREQGPVRLPAERRPERPSQPTVRPAIREGRPPRPRRSAPQPVASRSQTTRPNRRALPPRRRPDPAAPATPPTPPRPPATTATPPPSSAAAAARATQSRSSAARNSQVTPAPAPAPAPTPPRRTYSDREIRDATKAWHLDISERPPAGIRRYFDEFEETVPYTRYGPDGFIRIKNEDYGSRLFSLRTGSGSEMGYLELYAGTPKSNLSYQIQRRDNRPVLSWAMIRTQPKFQRQGVAGSLVEAVFDSMEPGMVLDADNYLSNETALRSRLSWIRRASQDPRINIMHSAADYDPNKVNVLNTPFCVGTVDDTTVHPAWIEQFEQLTGRTYNGDRTMGAIMNADSFFD